MSKPDPERAALRRALRDLEERSAGGAECPKPASLWESAAERLDPEEEAAVVDHLAACPACGQAWELAREMQRSAADAGTSPRPRARRRAAIWPLAAAAATLLVALGLWVAQRDVTPVGPPAYREPEPSWLVSTLDDASPLPRSDCVLRWAPGPEGTTYDLVVLDERLEPVARVWGLESPKHRLTPEELDLVPSGGRILWRVTAQLPDDYRLTSVTFINELE